MKTVTVAGLRFGEGIPKVCVPLTGADRSALWEEARVARDLPADLYEWRLDYYADSYSRGLRLLEEALAGKPLLCTLRSEGEGGRARLSAEAYESFLLALLEQGGFQLLDIELSCGDEAVARLVREARGRGVGTVVSRHDFARTPDGQELVDTLLHMKALGADLPKYAVTPQSPEDVLTLMGATLRAVREIGPVITMSMGSLGKLSRVSGGLTGSCLTFGAGANSSAPGQIGAEDLRAILEDLNGPFAQGEERVGNR